MENRSKSEELVALLLRRGLTLSAAESCTGGWFAKSVVDVSGASAVFFGGVVSYVNAVKENVLCVPHALIEAHTAVSAPVARAMAEGVVRLTGSDIGISVTGLAGPGGGSEEIPIGRVFVAVCRAKEETVVHSFDLRGTREEIRLGAVNAMTDMLIELLS